MRETVLIVGGGLLQIPAIRTAQAAGYTVFVTDRDPSAVGFEEADAHAVIDTKDVEGHVQLASELAADEGLAAVFTEGADVEVTVAEAARAVGLPSVDPRAARICNDKTAFRRCCAEAGLPGPLFEEARTLGEARHALRLTGLPAIVKAVDNSGSRGATKIESEEELPEAFEEAMRWSSRDGVLIEQCLSGGEQSVETIVAAGVHHRCNIVDRPFAFDPFPIELGHDNPTTLDTDQQEALYRLVEETARAVGIDMGAAKADTMWTDEGPVVIEMTARLSGGFHCQYTSPLAHGTNDIKAALDLALGRELDPSDIAPRWHRYAICRALFPSPGVIADVSGVEEALEIPGVEHVLFRMGIGDELRPYRHCADRVAFVITCAETREAALAAMSCAEETIEIVTRPAVPAA